MNPCLEAALSYAACGWHVFSVHGVTHGECTCRKPTCRNLGKHPCTPRGVLDATLDLNQIRDFWRKWPGAGVAIATGQPSGLLAIDIDPRNGGSESLFELERRHGELPKTVTSLTGGSGTHLLFQRVDGIKNQTSRIAPGIDVKSDGGYVIVPPSSHAAGKRYRWAEGLGPDEVEVAPCPEWLVSLLRRAQSHVTARALDGERNNHLASRAGSLRRRGLNTGEIESQLQEINEAECEPPLPAEEVRRVAYSIGRYPIGNIEPCGRDNSREVRRWPGPLEPEALYGISGEFIRLVEPHTEADTAALLVQFLVAFGNVIGRNSFFVVGAERHFPNMFGVLAGATAKGRKGTSESVVRFILKSRDAQWADDRVTTGLASGEGLIWQVRDPIEAREAIREKGRIVGYENAVSDQGIEDKRLLIVEPEFARVLQVCERETNTLSALVRQAWDSGDLRTLTKKASARSTGAHISIIAHITRDELVRMITDTAQVNGFVNRFLWVCVRRSKALPEPADLSKLDFGVFPKDLSEAIQFSKQPREIKRDNEARELWNWIYGELSEGKPGLFGATTSRAEAQVTRLVLVYSLLDCSEFVRRKHLQAALAVWKYCEDSARYLFGDAVGDPVSDEILRALHNHPDGLARQEIRDLFNRHKSSAEIARALTLLSELGLASYQMEESGGRPTERWLALNSARKATKAHNLARDNAHDALSAHAGGSNEQ